MKLSLKSKKIIAISTAIVLVVAATVGCLVYSLALNKQITEAMSFEYFNTENVQIAELASTSYTKTLTATVLPSDAQDKSVDWSYAWEDSSITDDVTTYLSVVPSEDGSTTATVTCLKGFLNRKIIITVTTRVGGFSATCVVKYLGVPETLTIDKSAYSTAYDSTVSKDLTQIYSNSTYDIPLVLSNAMNSVGSGYGSYKITLTAPGTILVNNKVVTNSTGAVTNNTEEYTFSIQENSDGSLYPTVQIGSSFLTPIEVSIVNGKLHVVTKDAMLAYSTYSGNPAGSSTRTVTGMKNGQTAYYSVTVTETNTNLSQTINFKILSKVSGVNLSLTEINF